MNTYRATVIRNRMEQNSCIGKRKYSSVWDASKAAIIVGRRTGEPLVTYECVFCGVFHVGHRKSRKRIEAERKLKKYGYTVYAK